MSFQKAPEAQVRTLPKGHLRCYHCKKVTPSKDGEWRTWASMQAFLCKICDKVTAKAKERK